jgi:hypothetical protein
MASDTTYPIFRRALGRHIAGLRGLRGVDAYLREGEGLWVSAARLGAVDPDRVEPALRGFDPGAGGAVEARADGQPGWAASYMLGGPGMDLCLLFTLDGMPPGELQAQLSLIEAKVGWLMLAALSDRKAEIGGVALGTEIGAQVLLDAARARNRRQLADQWIARLEAALKPHLIAVSWVRGDRPSLAALSGGGLVERNSDARSQIEALADFAVRARAPQVLEPEAPVAADGPLAAAPEADQPAPAAEAARQQAMGRVEALGGARALVLPVYQGDEADAVVVVIWTAEADPAVLSVEAADLVAQVLGETLDIQARAYPSILRRIGNWFWGLLVAVFGRTAWKLKLFLLAAVVIIGGLALWPTQFTPSFTARIEAQDRRVVSAPFDGFLAAAPWQLGDLIPAGEVIVAMEDSDLVLQIAQAQSELGEIETGIQTARAQRDSAEVQALEAQRRQVEVELELLARQQALARFEAEAAAVVVGGDAWRRVGGRVRLGEPLLELAAPGTFRVLAFIDEDWVADLAAGSTGELLLSAYPQAPMAVRLLTVTSDPQLRDGVNTFPAWMEFQAPPGVALLDGMRGVVRIDGGPTSMLGAYSRGALRWVNRTLWRWS